MKKIFLTISLAFTLSLFGSSCVTSYDVPQDGIYIETSYGGYRSDIDFSVIVRYGTPYYYEGNLLYYTYNGLYYYPFYHNNYWYVRVYQKPFMRPMHFTPNRYDYRFKPGRYQGFNKPVPPPSRPSMNVAPRRPENHPPQRISPQSRPSNPRSNGPGAAPRGRSQGRR